MNKKSQSKSSQQSLTRAESMTVGLVFEDKFSFNQFISNESGEIELVNSQKVATIPLQTLYKKTRTGVQPRRQLPYTTEEDLEIIEMYQKLGKKWKLISKKFPNKSRAAMRAHAFAIIRKAFKKLAGLCQLFTESRQLRKISFDTFDRFLKTPVTLSADQIDHLSLCLGRLISTPLDLVKIVIANEKNALEHFKQNEYLRQLAESQILSLVATADSLANSKAQPSEYAPLIGSFEKLYQFNQFPCSQNDSNFLDNLDHSQATMLHYNQEAWDLSQSLTKPFMCFDKIRFLEALHKQINLCNNMLFALSCDDLPKSALPSLDYGSGTKVDNLSDAKSLEPSLNDQQASLNKPEISLEETKLQDEVILKDKTHACHIQNQQAQSQDRESQATTPDQINPSKVYQQLERYHRITIKDNFHQASWLNRSFDSQSVHTELRFDEDIDSPTNEYDFLI